MTSAPARVAISRLPPNFENMQVVQALFSLIASVSERQYDRVYPKAEALLTSIRNFALPDYDIVTVTSVLVTAFLGTLSFTLE